MPTLMQCDRGSKGDAMLGRWLQMAPSFISSPFKNKTNKNPTCFCQLEHVCKKVLKTHIPTVQMGYRITQLATFGYKCAPIPGD